MKFKIEPAYLKFGEYKVEPDLKPEGDIKVEDGIKFEAPPPAGPGGIPSPYPNVAEEGESLGNAVARKAGEGQKEFLEVKLENTQISSARGVGDQPGAPEPGDDGLVDALARKSGGGGPQEYFDVKMEEVFVTSVSSRSEPQDEDGPDDDGDAFTDWIAKKRGKGGLGVSDEEPNEAFIGEDELPDDGTGVAAFMRPRPRA